MTADNFEKTLKSFQERLPFHSFTVVLLSGKQFEVEHPEAFVHRDGVEIFVGPGGVPVVFDREGVEHFFGDLGERPAS